MSAERAAIYKKAFSKSNVAQDPLKENFTVYRLCISCDMLFLKALQMVIFTIVKQIFMCKIQSFQ